MIKKWIVTLIIFFLSAQAFAEVHIYFLSRELTSSVFETTWTQKLAFNSKDIDCTPMGDGCFHPQYGIIKDDGKKSQNDSNEAVLPKSDDIKTINAEEVDLINCDGNYYFDMFCGKAKKRAAPADFELWVDVSASMRQVDFSKDQNFCERRRLVAKLKDACTDSVDIYSFNTSKKLLGALNNTCLNYGTNNGQKVVDWIKSNESENLVIITDVDEYRGALREYLDIISAKVYGIGTEVLTAKDLIKKFSALSKLCK